MAGPEGFPSWVPFFGGEDTNPNTRQPGESLPAWIQRVFGLPTPSDGGGGGGRDGSPGQAPPDVQPPALGPPTEPTLPGGAGGGGSLPPYGYPTGLEGLYGPPQGPIPPVLASQLPPDAWKGKYWRNISLERLLRSVPGYRKPRPRVPAAVRQIRTLERAAGRVLARGAAAVVGAVGAVPAVVGVILGGYPTATAPGDIPGAMEAAKQNRERIDRVRARRAQEGRELLERMAQEQVDAELEEERRVQTGAYGRDLIRGALERAGVPSQIAERVVPPPAAPQPRREYPTVPQIGQMGPPSPAPAPAPTPRGRRILQRVTGAMANPYARAGVIGLGIVSAAAARRRSSAPGISQPRNVPVPSFDTAPRYQPFTSSMQPAGRPSQTCNCAKKKRGPARRCLERGTVQWKTGRKKGQAAGTKCIRWAS